MFSNSTTLQLIYVDSLKVQMAQMIGGTVEEAKTRGFITVLIYSNFVNCFRWSIGYNMMKPDKKEVQAVENINETKEQLVESKESFKDSKNHLLEKEKKQAPSAFWVILKGTLNMPFISGLVGMTLASLPCIGSWLKDKSSVGNMLIVHPCSVVGKAASVVGMIILGLTLTISIKVKEEGGTEAMSKLALWLVLFAKAFVQPLCGLLFIWVLGFDTNIMNDPIVGFLLLTMFCTPTAVNMATIAVINEFQNSNLARLLIYQYVMGIVTISLWTAVYLSLFVKH